MANKILVAEDDAGFRDSLVESLEVYCNDVDIVTASTREEALTIIQNADDLSIIVTDLRMPRFGDGEAVASAAQEKGIKVIVLSSSIDDLNKAVREKCLAVFDKKDTMAKEIANKINASLTH